MTPKARSPNPFLHVAFVFPNQTKDCRVKRSKPAWWMSRPFPANSYMVFTKELAALFFLAGLVTSAFNKGQA